MTNTLVAVALIWHEDKILLVRNKGCDRYPSFWGFPGGMAEEGETAHDALRREVFEEVGATVDEIKKLAYVGQYISTASDKDPHNIFLAFECSVTPQESFKPEDPDGEIVEAKFFSLEEAVTHAKNIPFKLVKEPAMDYLINYSRGETPYWSFQG